MSIFRKQLEKEINKHQISLEKFEQKKLKMIRSNKTDLETESRIDDLECFVLQREMILDLLQQLREGLECLDKEGVIK